MPPSVDAPAFGTDRGRAAARGTVTGDRDPYKVLGVDRGADPEVVAAAYRALARRHHPDVSRSPDAERRMAEANAAWTILRPWAPNSPPGG